MSYNLNVGLSVSILILFFIIIGVGYTYVDESRKNNDDARHSIDEINRTQNKFLEAWKEKQKIDNVRFNDTLDTLNKTYHLIIQNQRLIIDASNAAGHFSKDNLNLTKFNRASLTDSNYVIREIAKHFNVTLTPFNGSNIH